VICSKTGRSAEILRCSQAVSHPVRPHRRGGAELDGGAFLRSPTIGRHARGSLRSSAVPGQPQSAYAAQSLPPRPPVFPLGVPAAQKTHQTYSRLLALKAIVNGTLPGSGVPAPNGSAEARACVALPAAGAARWRSERSASTVRYGILIGAPTAQLITLFG
jgi:hypothetical protein